MSSQENDDLLEQLSALPAHDVAPDTANRIARTARAALADSTQAPGWLGSAERFYARFIEVPLVFGACAVYLGWAAAALHATGFAAAERAMEATAQGATQLRYAEAREASERMMALR